MRYPGNDHTTVVFLLLSLSMAAAFGAQATSAEQDNSGLSPRDNKGERPERAYNYQIGTLGMTVSLKLNTNDCEVVDVKPGGLAALNGIKVNDQVAQVNGQAIQVYKVEGDAWDGSSALKNFGVALSNPGKKMTLAIRRDEDVRQITLDFSREARSGTYLNYADTLAECDRAAGELQDLLTYMTSKFKAKGLYGPHGVGQTARIQTAVLGLLLMNLPEGHHDDTIHKIFRSLTKERYPKDKNVIDFEPGYFGVFLCEYYLRYKSKEALAEIQYLLDLFHGRLDDKGLSVPEPADGHWQINVIKAHAYLFLVMAGKCGLEVDPVKKQGIKTIITESIGSDGSMAYVGKGGQMQKHGFYRASLACIALRLDGEKELAERIEKWIVKNGAYALNGHCLFTMTLMWTFVAVKGAQVDPALLDEHYRTWHWYFNVTTPDKTNREILRYYVPGSREDCYFNLTDLNHLIHAMIFSLTNKNITLLTSRAFIEGVNPAKLTPTTQVAYDLIGEGKLAKAYVWLQRAESRLASNEQDAACAARMKEHIVKQTSGAVEKLRALSQSPDVLALQALVEQLKPTYGGITPFDEASAPIEKSLREEPRRTQLEIGRQYQRVLETAKKSRSEWSLGALERFAASHEGTYYGKLALHALAGLKGEAQPPLPDPSESPLPQVPAVAGSPVSEGAREVGKPDSGRTSDVLAQWQARFVKKLDSCVRSGKRLKMKVSGQDYVVVGASDAKLIVGAQGGQLPMPWSWLSPKDRLDLANGMATDDDVEALLIAAVFSQEMGMHEQAETLFARASLKDPAAAKAAREQPAPSGGP